MKVKIIKNLENGKYHIKIMVSDFDDQELENIRKFGSPMISISPTHVWKGSRLLYSLPIYDLGHDFQFNTEEEAISFIDSMTERIKEAVTTLKQSEDKFTGEEELNF